MSDPAPGITATPHEENLRYFDVMITGPEGSPFAGECPAVRAGGQPWPASDLDVPAGLGRPTEHELTRALPPSTPLLALGGHFKLELFLPEEYPMSPPKVRFLTKI